VSDADEADEAVASTEAFVLRSQSEPLTVVPPVQATMMPPVVVQAASIAAPQGPAADRFEVAQIVQQVTRTLAWRDLDALQAGREVVLHLDEALMPQTVLTFRPAVAGPGAAADGLGAEVVVSLQTQSTEVREFLDTHGQALVEAMARQAPGLRWAPTPELAWQGGTAPVVTPALTTDTAFSRPANVLTQAADNNAARAGRAELPVTDPTLRTGDNTLQVASTTSSGAAGQQAWQGDDGASSSGRGQGSSGQQERDPSQGQSSGQGQGQQGQQGQGQGSSPSANDRADADAAARWYSQSEAARSQAAAAFADAVEAQAG
jgi:hypothetical protein